MKALVIGGAGFIGSHIVDKLVELHYDTYVLDNLVTGLKSNVNKSAKFYLADITNEGQLNKVFNKVKPDIVFHLAAQVDVCSSIKDPIYDAKVNIYGVLNVLNCCKKYNVRKIIYSSSGGALYGECNNPKDEHCIPSPVSPYGLSKFVAEEYIRILSSLNKMNYVILRYSNVYGPRQGVSKESGVISIFIPKIMHDEYINIYGDGSQTRDYIYVSDVADANIKAAFECNNKVINISTGVSISVKSLAVLIAKLLSTSLKIRCMNRRDGEICNSVLCNDYAKNILNWAHKVDLTMGLMNTIDYYKSINK